MARYGEPQQVSSLLQIALAPAAAPPRTVYDELINAGFFAEVGDPPVRNAIAEYYAALDYLQGQITYGRSVLTSIGQWRGEGVELAFDRDQVSQRVRIYDLELLHDNQGFMQYLLEGHGIQKNNARFWRDALTSAETMCAELSRFTKRPCSDRQSDQSNAETN